MILRQQCLVYRCYYFVLYSRYAILWVIKIIIVQKVNEKFFVMLEIIE
jgi:hypothetical protein